jgi:hypothetical protein
VTVPSLCGSRRLRVVWAYDLLEIVMTTNRLWSLGMSSSGEVANALLNTPFLFYPAVIG